MCLPKGPEGADACPSSADSDLVEFSEPLQQSNPGCGERIQGNADTPEPDGVMRGIGGEGVERRTDCWGQTRCIRARAGCLPDEDRHQLDHRLPESRQASWLMQ